MNPGSAGATFVVTGSASVFKEGQNGWTAAHEVEM